MFGNVYKNLNTFFYKVEVNILWLMLDSYDVVFLYVDLNFGIIILLYVLI